MNTDFLYGPVAGALGWTLLHAIWQGFALVLPAALALHVLRDRSGSVRYNVGVLTLLAQVLASVATFVWYYQPVAAHPSGNAATVAAGLLPTYWPAQAQPLPWHQQVEQFLAGHLGQFVLLYLIGVIVFALRLAGGWLYVLRLSRAATLPQAAIWTNRTEKLRVTLGVRQTVRFRESARIAVPMVVGVLKPVVLWPVSLSTGLTTAEIEAVLAHELAHIKRHDYAVNLLQSVIEVLYFFHPALWWLSARIREEREHACDDLALRTIGGNGPVLARALARVEALRIEPAATPALAMAFSNKQLLLHRVRRMLGVPTRPVVSNGSLAGLTLATVLLIGVSVYAAQPPQPKPAKKPHSTVRYRAAGKVEFGIADGQTIRYVIWKGQRLPASHVARLQREWNQTMAGQLNLDDVAQPDRDILLEIIEKQYSVKAGMNALSGLDQIDSDNIVNTTLSTALTNMSGSLDGLNGTLAELEKTNFDSLADNALASGMTSSFLKDSLTLNQNNHPLADTLPTGSKVDSQLWAEYARLFAEQAKLYEQMGKPQSQINALYRQLQLPWRELQRLQSEMAIAQRMSVEFEQRAGKSDVATKAPLLEKAAEQNNRIAELSRRIRDVSDQRIRAYSDSIRYKSAAIRLLSDSIRLNSEKIRSLSDQLRTAQARIRARGNSLEPPTPVEPITPVMPQQLNGRVESVRPPIRVRPNVLAKPVKPVKPAPRPVPNVVPVPPKP